MKKGTVRRCIFVSDTAMVLTTLFLFLLVNLLVLKIYSEAIEKAFLDSAEQIVNAQELEELLKQRILYQNKFLLLTAADGIACVLILIGVSRFFTRNLTSHIMEPLDTLAEGAKRIQNNDLQQAKTSATPAPRSLRRVDISANHFCRTANPSALPSSRSPS